MKSLFGMPVVVHPFLKDSTPVLQVSDSCPMTDEGRASMNKFLLETFGENRNFYMVSGHIFASTNNAARLRVTIEKDSLNHEHRPNRT